MKTTFEILDARFEKERSIFMRDQHIKVLKDLISEMEQKQRGE